jgi:hypothetical protein
MNNRKKQWEQEVQSAIKGYEYQTGNEYDYYGKRSRKVKTKWNDRKGSSYWINWIIRFILGISMIALTVSKMIGLDLIGILFKGR